MITDCWLSIYLIYVKESQEKVLLWKKIYDFLDFQFIWFMSKSPRKKIYGGRKSMIFLQSGIKCMANYNKIYNILTASNKIYDFLTARNKIFDKWG